MRSKLFFTAPNEQAMTNMIEALEKDRGVLK